MGRQFNFMPSRYVTEPSRHVTPSHTDASRSERDTGVTSGGQNADIRRTGGAVPRDNHGTDAAVTGDKRGANALVTRDAPMTDAEREARAERRSRAFSEEWSHKRLMQGLGELRIHGRHSLKPVDIDLLSSYFNEFGIPAHTGRAAYEAGQRDTARGVRCMCTTCNGQRAADADGKRAAYSTRRYHELRAQGASFAYAWRCIDMEISRGDHIER